MHFVQMRSFHAVALTGSFVAASRMLHVSQPTITTQVKMLEETYGVELFARRGRGVQLTESGKDLFALTQKTMACLQESVEYLKDAKGLRSGHLRIAAVGSQQVTSVLPEFYRRYPQIRITLEFGNSKAVEEAIAEYRADVGFLAEFSDLSRFHRIRYSHPEIVAVVNKDHAWRARSQIQMKELEGQPLVMRELGSETRRIVEQAARKARVPLTTIMEIRSRDGVLAAVAGAIGIGFASEEEVAAYPLHRLRIRDVDMHTYVDIACLKERRSSRLHRAFFEVAEALKKNR